MYQTRINNGKKRAPKHRVLFEPDENGQQYAVIKDMMGNGRVRVLCEDDELRMGRIRGSMRKCGHKVLIERGDLVIIALRDFEDDKVDIVHKYNYDEGTQLAKENALPDNIRRAWMNSMDVGGASSAADIANDKYIVFGEESAIPKGISMAAKGSATGPMESVWEDDDDVNLSRI